MLTELDVVNEMLSAVGMAPVTAQDTRHPSYNKASNKLRTVMNKVQNLGLWFNTTYPTLRKNTAGEIILPAGTLHCDPTNTKINAAKRGSKLFNLDKQNFVFDADVKVKLVVQLGFRDLPETAKQYIKDSARYEYYLDEDGTEPKLSNLREAQNVAWVVFYRDHLRNRDTNYFRGPNYANDLARGRNRQRLPGPQE